MESLPTVVSEHLPWHFIMSTPLRFVSKEWLRALKVAQANRRLTLSTYDKCLGTFKHWASTIRKPRRRVNSWQRSRAYRDDNTPILSFLC